MVIYKNTGLKDYIYFISQNGLKGDHIIFERIDVKNNFFHLPKDLIHLYNVDLDFWKVIKSIKLI